MLKRLLLSESRRLGRGIKRQRRLVGEVGKPRQNHGNHGSGCSTKGVRAEVIPTSVLQKVLYPRAHDYLVRPKGFGPHIPRVKRWKEAAIVPSLKWGHQGPYLWNRTIRVPSVEILHGMDVLEYQDRPDRNIDRLKRTFYVASFLATITGKVNHAFTRGFSLFVRGYFRTSRKLFHSYVEGIKRMYKLSTRSIGLLLSLVHQANNLCMQIAGF